jgi:hypothetical protein
MLNRSGNTKRGTKRVGGSRDIWETLWFHARQGEVIHAENRLLRFAPRNTFVSCIRLWVLGRSGNTKRGSNAISGCRENCETMCPFSLPLMLSHEDNVPQFFRQPLAVFGSRFNFPDRLNILEHLQRPKTVRHRNLRRRFPRRPACRSLVTSIFLAILIISAKVNPFRDTFHDSGPIWHQSTLTSAWYILPHDLRLPNLNLYEVRIMGGIFIREYLHVEEQCSVANSTLINHVLMLNKVSLIQSSWILTSTEKCIEVGLVVLNLLFLHENE